jgi:uncharacterized Fe-S cluster protein YjdI
MASNKIESVTEERPWIKPEASSTERIIEQVKRCPSGALSFYINEIE